VVDGNNVNNDLEDDFDDDSGFINPFAPVA
jgi:hypothetical protein